MLCRQLNLKTKMLYELFNFYLWIGNIWTAPCFSIEAHLIQPGPVTTEVPPTLIAMWSGKNKTKQANHTCETRKEIITEASSCLFSWSCSWEKKQQFSSYLPFCARDCVLFAAEMSLVGNWNPSPFSSLLYVYVTLGKAGSVLRCSYLWLRKSYLD